MDQKPPATIFDVANLCSNLFTKYLNHPVTIQNEVAGELRDRFRMWASYIGVFAEPGLSLDDRLIFHEDVKDQVLKLLYMVQRNVQSALMSDKIHGGQHEDRRPSSKPRSIMNNSEPLEFGAPLHGLKSVSVALDRLDRLATAIRRTSTESQKWKLLTKNSKIEGDSYFEDCICRFIQDRFPSARASLVEQLTAAMYFHRKRLLYQPRHNRQLAHRRQSKSQQARTHLQLDSPLACNAHTQSSNNILASRRGLDATIMSTTDASIPHSQLRRAVIQGRKPALTIASTGTSMYGEVFYYPDPPHFSPEEKLHPCPYCSEPLDTFKLDMGKHNNVKFWREHVNQDLEPYFCVSEQCREPLQFFIHYEDWLKHMNASHSADWARSIHMRTWYCDIGHNDRHLFDNKTDFEAHMRTLHRNLTESQLIARMRRSQTVASREPLSCPLCDSIPNNLAPINAQRERPEAVSGLIGEHVARHIKALSLLSFRLLSCCEDGDGSQESFSSPLRSTSMHTRDEDSIVQQRMGVHSEDSLSRFTNVSVTDRPVEEHFSGQEYSESWDFLPSFAYLRNLSKRNVDQQQSGNPTKRRHLLVTASMATHSSTFTQTGSFASIAESLVHNSLRGISGEERQWLLPPQQPDLKGRKCLILDLEGTLLHTSFKILHQADFTIPVESEGQYRNCYVMLRPGVNNFLKCMGKLFEIVLFSENVAQLTDPVVDRLDIHHVIHYRLFRESCYNHQNNYVKDLSQLGRDLRQVIILDNSPISYLFHPINALPITSWWSDADDTELLDLIPVLEDLAHEDIQDVSLVLDIVV